MSRPSTSGNSATEPLEDCELSALQEYWDSPDLKTEVVPAAAYEQISVAGSSEEDKCLVAAQLAFMMSANFTTGSR